MPFGRPIDDRYGSIGSRCEVQIGLAETYRSTVHPGWRDKEAVLRIEGEGPVRKTTVLVAEGHGQPCVARGIPHCFLPLDKTSPRDPDGHGGWDWQPIGKAPEPWSGTPQQCTDGPGYENPSSAASCSYVRSMDGISSKSIAAGHVSPRGTAPPLPEPPPRPMPGTPRRVQAGYGVGGGFERGRVEVGIVQIGTEIRSMNPTLHPLHGGIASESTGIPTRHRTAPGGCNGPFGTDGKEKYPKRGGGVEFPPVCLPTISTSRDRWEGWLPPSSHFPLGGSVVPSPTPSRLGGGGG